MSKPTEILFKAFADNIDWEPGQIAPESQTGVVIDQALQALHAATIAALPIQNPYKTSDGQVPESFEAPAHAYDVAISDMKAAIDELYGVKQ